MPNLVTPDGFMFGCSSRLPNAYREDECKSIIGSTHRTTAPVHASPGSCCSTLPVSKTAVQTRAGSMSFGGDLAGLSQALLSAGPLGSSLLVLTVVIALHEAGHFIAARSQGIRVKTFSIGFGPKLLSYKPKGGEMSGILWPGGKGSNGQGRPRVESVNGKIVAEEGVEYTLRAIPVGGFVSFPNNWTEDKEGNIIEYEDPDLLQNRGPGQRVVVVVAGIVANLVLAWGCMFGYISTVGVVHQIYSPGLVINEMTSSEGPAAQAGFQPKDVLLSLNGSPLTADRGALDKAVGMIRASNGNPIALEISRGGGAGVTRMVQPKLNDAGRYSIGVRLASNVESTGRVMPKGPVSGASMALEETARLVQMTFESLLQLVKSGSAEGMSGPVKIVEMGAEVATADGPSALLQFAAVISVNLAVVNALPVPGLDGGQMVFIIAELAGRKKLDRGVTETINGLALLILFMVSLSTFASDLGVVTLLKRLVTGGLSPPN